MTDFLISPRFDRPGTTPAFSWFETDALWDQKAIDDGPRNSYRVGDRAKLVLGTHDTSPLPAWIFQVLPNPIPPIPSGIVELLNSYRPPSRAVLRLGTHDTAPVFSWLKPLNLKDPVPPAKQASSATRWTTRFDSTFRSRV